MMVEYEGLQVAMDCKPKHIILPELDFKTSNKYQNSIGIIGGSHTDISIQELQKNRFIKIVWQEELPGRCKALKAEHIFGDEILKKQFGRQSGLRSKLWKLLKKLGIIKLV